MLKLIELKHPKEKLSVYEGFDPKSQTWIVSDLRSKFDIQQRILEFQGFYEDESVLRASELWRILIKRKFPLISIISRDNLRINLKNRFRDVSSKDQIANIEVLLEKAFDEFCSIFISETSHQNLTGWLEANPQSSYRWGQWYHFARKYFLEIVEKDRILNSWSPSIINEHDWESKMWQRPLVVDLSANITRPEAELLKKISQYIDVSVMVPRPEWHNNFRSHLAAYEILASANSAPKSKSQELQTSTLRPNNFTAHKMSNPVAEVKFVTAKVRDWLEQGVQAKQIGIFCPNSEDYWPILEKYLRVEGIPVSKDLLAKLHSFQPVETWLSSLRIACRTITYGNLEEAFFGKTKSSHLNTFERFYGLFAKLIDVEDLKVDMRVFQQIKFADLQKPLARDLFIAWSLDYWPSDDKAQFLELILRDLLKEFAEHEEFILPHWLYYIEQIAAKIEMPLRKGVIDGVQINNISVGESSRITHRIFVGLSESQVRPSRDSFLNSQESARLLQDLGLHIVDKDESNFDFDLRWHLELESIESILTYPSSSFEGSAESPAAIWIEKAGGINHELTMPPINRWQELANTADSSELPDQTSFLPVLEMNLSASSIEKFLECPFTFYVSKVLALEDPEFVDIDLDHRRKGILLHKIFELLVKELSNYRQASDFDLLTVIDKARESTEKIYFFDESIWQAQRVQYLAKVKRFIRLEEEWISQVGEITPLATEGFFKFSFAAIEGAPNMQFTGRIDRIDKTTEGLLITDFKSSVHAAKNGKKILTSPKIQLFLYWLALESRAVKEISDAEIVGALLYSANKGERRDGILKDGEIFAKLKETGLVKKTVVVQETDLQPLRDEFSKLMSEVLTSLKAGNFAPQPINTKDCVSCTWRNLCRAPHLV